MGSIVVGGDQYGVVFFTKPGEVVTVSHTYPMVFRKGKKKKVLTTETPYGPARSTNARHHKKRN